MVSDTRSPILAIGIPFAKTLGEPVVWTALSAKRSPIRTTDLLFTKTLGEPEVAGLPSESASPNRTMAGRAKTLLAYATIPLGTSAGNGMI